MQNAEELLKKLRYDEESGQFFWIAPPRKGVGVDRPAGYTSNAGYRQIRYKKVLYHCHKLVILLKEGVYPDLVDHKDRDRGNNRYKNLRVADDYLNSWNSGVRNDNKTGHKGVHKLPSGKYIAYLTRYKKTKYLGRFNKLEEAVNARKTYEETFDEKLL